MEIGLIGFFLLNMVMMLFVSIFNSNRRIFRFGLVMVSLSLNMLPYTITCILLIVLSSYYQYLDEVAYKVLLDHKIETILLSNYRYMHLV
jgi:hypothetical protein